ncbi:MAG: hypothetical protein WBM35_08745 [Candidatus Electrothrix sp.]
MANKKLSLCFAGIMTIMLCSVASGQVVEDPCRQSWSTPLAEVEGEIVKVYYHSYLPVLDQEGLHLEISESSSGEHVVIHVFPKNCIEKYPDKFEFLEGEIVTVIGSEFSSNPEELRNICAAEIIQRPELQLRTLDTGCLNMQLCVDCQGTCEVSCAGVPNPSICMDTCLSICESKIIPCEASGNPVTLTPIYPLLLVK